MRKTSLIYHLMCHQSNTKPHTYLTVRNTNPVEGWISTYLSNKIFAPFWNVVTSRDLIDGLISVNYIFRLTSNRVVVPRQGRQEPVLRDACFQDQWYQGYQFSKTSDESVSGQWQWVVLTEYRGSKACWENKSVTKWRKAAVVISSDFLSSPFASINWQQWVFKSSISAIASNK